MMSVKRGHSEWGTGEDSGKTKEVGSRAVKDMGSPTRVPYSDSREWQERKSGKGEKRDGDCRSKAGAGRCEKRPGRVWGAGPLKTGESMGQNTKDLGSKVGGQANEITAVKEGAHHNSEEQACKSEKSSKKEGEKASRGNNT